MSLLIPWRRITPLNGRRACKKGGIDRSAHGAAVWRPVVMHLLFYRVSVRHSLAEAGMLGPGNMSEVIIKDMKKVYDNKVTAVHDFNLHIADKEFIVLVGPSG